MSRNWVKLWVKESLFGEFIVNYEPENRAVWYELLMLAGDGSVDGIICIANDIPYTNAQIAKVLHCPQALIKQTIAKLLSDKMIAVNENGIHIVNWEKYQSEYNRLKQYKSTTESTNKSTTESTGEGTAKGTDFSSPSSSISISLSNLVSTLGDDYITGLKEKFPTLDVTIELERCALHWESKGKVMENHKSAVLTWLRNQVKYDKERTDGKHRGYSGKDQSQNARRGQRLPTTQELKDSLRKPQ